jgi:hypothetical protein
MLDAPRQDWSAYQAKADAFDRQWLHGLTVEDRFAMYSDLFNLVQNSRVQSANREELDRWHWQQKLAARHRMFEAFQKLDAYRERTAKHHAG